MEKEIIRDLSKKIPVTLVVFANPYSLVNADYISDVKSIKMGDVENFTNFMNAVIDEASFDNIASCRMLS